MTRETLDGLSLLLDEFSSKRNTILAEIYGVLKFTFLRTSFTRGRTRLFFLGTY